jgi:hypothetical protein
MRAVPVVPKGLVAVVAQSAQTFWVAVLSTPTEKIAAATQLLSVPVAAAINVVDAQELVSGLAATGAHFAIVVDGFGALPTLPNGGRFLGSSRRLTCTQQGA